MIYLRNEKGMSLVSVLVLGATIIGTSVVLLKQGDIAESRRKFQTYQDQESSFEKSLNDFLSSGENCKKSFTSLVSLNSSGVLNVNSGQYSLLKNNLSSNGNGKIIFDDIDFDISRLVQTSPVSTSPSNEINEKLNVETVLDVKINRQNTKSIKLFSKTLNVKNISLPIRFEFYKETTGWKLISCNSNYSKEEVVRVTQAACDASFGVFNVSTQKCKRETLAYTQRKKNCKASGGELDSQNICRIKTNDYEIKNDVLITNSLLKYTLQDSLCILDNSIARQDSTSDESQLYSKFCPRVKYGGCVASNSSLLKTGKGGEYFVGALRGDALRTKVSTIISDGVNARTERIATQLRVVDSLKSPGVNLNNSYAENSFKENKTNYSKYAVGAVLFGGVGLVIAAFADQIFNCDENRRIYSNEICKNGKMEVHYVRTEKQKFKCKKWSCKCRWVGDVTQVAPTESEIAKALLLQGNLEIAQSTKENVVTGADIEAEADQQIADIKADLDSSVSIEDFYQKLNSIEIESESNSSSDKASLKLSQIYTDKLKAMIKVKEIAMWDLFKSQISINLQTNGFNTVFNYLDSKSNTINSLEVKLAVAAKSETSTPAKSKIYNIEKDLINHLKDQMNNSTTKSSLEAFNPAGYSSRFKQASPSEVAELASTYKTNLDKYSIP